MGGTVGLKGKLQHPKIMLNQQWNFRLFSLNEVSISRNYPKNFLTVEKLAPIMKYASGKISHPDFDMTTDLTTVSSNQS